MQVGLDAYGAREQQKQGSSDNLDGIVLNDGKNVVGDTYLAENDDNPYGCM